MSTPQAPGLIRQLWYRWKKLQLPWRKQFLVGADLAGNTYWIFKDALHANRWRRIVRYSSKVHYSDVKVTRMHIQPRSMDEELLTGLAQRNGTNGSAIPALKHPLSRSNNTTSRVKP